MEYTKLNVYPAVAEMLHKAKCDFYHKNFTTFTVQSAIALYKTMGVDNENYRDLVRWWEKNNKK